RKVQSPKLVAAMPDFIEPQLCRLVEVPPRGRGWLHEVKIDGHRIQMRIEDGTVTLKTRAGLDWTRKFPTIAAAAEKLLDALIDGEVAALDQRGVPDFGALQAAIAESKTKDLIFFAFDLMFEGREDLRALALRERKARVMPLLGDSGGNIRYVEHIEAEGDQVLDSASRLSLEGIVSKRADARYHAGRHDDWVKVKCRTGHEVVVGGWSGD